FARKRRSRLPSRLPSALRFHIGPGRCNSLRRWSPLTRCRSGGSTFIPTQSSTSTRKSSLGRSAMLPMRPGRPSSPTAPPEKRVHSATCRSVPADAQRGRQNSASIALIDQILSLPGCSGRPVEVPREAGSMPGSLAGTDRLSSNRSCPEAKASSFKYLQIQDLSLPQTVDPCYTLGNNRYKSQDSDFSFLLFAVASESSIGPACGTLTKVRVRLNSCSITFRFRPTAETHQNDTEQIRE